MDDPQRKPKLCNLGVWPLTWAIVLLSILVSFHAAEAVHGERAGEGLQIHKKGDRAGDIHAEFQRQNSTNEAAGQGTPISIELPKLPLVVNSSDGLPSRDQMQASLACEVDLGGKGSLDATCELKDSVTLSSASSIQGAGNLTLLQGVTINCSLPDCLIKITLGGDLKLLKDARIEGGQLHIEAENVVIKKGGAISAQALGGKPPPQTSGSPTTSDGSGGGHGGRVRGKALSILPENATLRSHSLKEL